MQISQTTKGLNIGIFQEKLPADSALSGLTPALDTRKGVLLSSGFDYPGRHSRWDIGFVDPALEFVSHARSFKIQALNAQGSLLIDLLFAELKTHPHIESLAIVESKLGCIQGLVAPFPEYFIEEQRSRQPSIFSVLRALVSFFESTDPRLSHLGLYGAFGYDLVLQFEELEQKHKRDNDIADCHLYLPLEVVVVDRKREDAFRVSYSIETQKGWTHEVSGGGKDYPNQSELGSSASETVECDHKEGEFAKKVAKVIEGAKKGDYFEVVLSQEFFCRYPGKPTDLFETLCKVNPSPYMFLLNLGGEQLIGASPEIYVRVTDGLYETCPIAGTVRRGENAIEDAKKVKELIGSLKDESELTMCTDVDRNDMARVCKPGSVQVVGRRELEFYSHLIHTVDHLTGELKDEFDALDAFQTHMWACTVTGAPKPAALQEIENLENSPRGWYSGAIGMLSFQGNINTGILLRTAHVKHGIAKTRSGATILYDSTPELEEIETRTKAAAFLSALAQTKTPEVKTKAPLVKAKLKRKVLLVDCHDSFIHMLADYLRQLGADVTTVRNGFPQHILKENSYDLVLLSPGPGTPEEFGVPKLVGTLKDLQIPTLGVCLGHQGIGQYFGAKLAQLPEPMHGKPSVISHNQSSLLFTGIAESLTVGRYHSLYLEHDSLPAELVCTASCTRVAASGEHEIIPMAIEHKSLPIAGVQFHPESLMSLEKNAGHAILRNVLDRLVS